MRVISASLALALVAYATAVAAPPPRETRPIMPPAAAGRHWRLVFDQEFNGTALDHRVWSTRNGWTHQNGVTAHLGNVAVSGGHLILTLASRWSGAELATRAFRLRVGEYVQARIEFAGAGSTIYNWPAWWTAGPAWPAGGENDIAEGMGQLTINYHWPGGDLETGSVHGAWGDGFHTYGLYRGLRHSRVYWDGRLVRTYRTYDSGAPETLLLTLGEGNRIVTGVASEMVVDYIRAWAPA
ncbi:MAG: glycoside hydrolase family 16 protein [Acidobacteriota bacterium]|nr:glycoside hydrolase family 16 protein [Acidobacteriota bacterium]